MNVIFPPGLVTPQRIVQKSAEHSLSGLIDEGSQGQIAGVEPMKARVGCGQRVVKYWLPVLLGMAVIYLFSTGVFSSANTKTILRFLIPGISPPEVRWVDFLIRRVAHVAEYFILGLLLFRAFRGGANSRFHWRWSFFALTALVILAAGDEFHQFFVPTRSASPTDVGIDTAGGMLAQFASALWYVARMK